MWSHDDRLLIRFGLLLGGLLFVGTPVLVVGLTLPTILTVSFVGFVYGVVVVLRRRLVDGLVAATLVLVTFYADLPVYASPSGRIGLYLFDVALVPLVLLLVYRGWLDDPHSTERSILGLMTVFVVWTFLAGVFGAVESLASAVGFAFLQLRYLLVLIVGLGVGRRYSVSAPLFVLGAALAGHLSIAIIESALGGPLGLTYLGDAWIFYGHIRPVVIGPVQFRRGLFAGGFVGQSRVLIGTVLLVLPAWFYLAASRPRLRLSLAPLALTIPLVLVIADTDAGWGALFLTLFVTASALLMIRYRADDRTASVALVAVAGTLATSIGTLLADFETAPAPEPASGSSGTGTVDTGAASGGSTPGFPYDVIADTIQEVPLLRTDTLQVRLEQLAAAVDVAYANPLFGLGGWNFRFVATRYGLPDDVSVHNTFFALASEVGVPAMIVFVAVSILVFVATVRPFREEWPDPSRTATTLLLIGCGMLGFHALSFWIVLYFSPVPYAVFWFLAGTVVALSGRRTVGSRGTATQEVG
jgi:hypothetical protein